MRQRKLQRSLRWAGILRKLPATGLQRRLRRANAAADRFQRVQPLWELAVQWRLQRRGRARSLWVRLLWKCRMQRRLPSWRRRRVPLWERAVPRRMRLRSRQRLRSVQPVRLPRQLRRNRGRDTGPCQQQRLRTMWKLWLQWRVRRRRLWALRKLWLQRKLRRGCELVRLREQWMQRRLWMAERALRLRKQRVQRRLWVAERALRLRSQQLQRQLRVLANAQVWQLDKHQFPFPGLAFQPCAEQPKHLPGCCRWGAWSDRRQCPALEPWARVLRLQQPRLPASLLRARDSEMFPRIKKNREAKSFIRRRA